MIKFGPYELRPSSRELYKFGLKVRLRPQPFQVLNLLLDHPGEVVTREQFQQQLWTSDTFVDFEHGLNTSIKELRALLADSPTEPRYIQTLPKLGDRFIFPVEFSALAIEPTSLPPQPALPAGAPLVLSAISELPAVPLVPALAPGVAPRRRSTWLFFAAAVLLIGVIAMTARIATIRHPLAGAASASIKSRPSIAVLGFKNLSNRPDEDWMSTAITEMLAAELASGQQIRVIPGEDIARMKLDLSLPPSDTYGRETLGKIHTHLGTDMIASGSFLALNNGSTVNLRIVLQFQDTHTGETVATFTQDGTQGDFLQLVSAGGDNLRHTLGIGSLSLTAAREARAAVPSNSAAERLYAQGLTQLQTFDPLAARALLEKAIAADPDHALSRSALAESLSALGYDLEAQAQAKKAVDLSANLSREDRLAIEGRYRELTHDRPAALEIYRTLHNFFPDNLDYGLRFARAQNLAGHPADALQTVAALRHLPPPQGQDARIDLLDASAYDRLGDMPRSQAAAAALRAQAQGSRLMLANAIDQEAWAWVNLGQPDKAIANDTRAREIWLAVGDPRHAAVALHGLAIYQHNKGDLPAAGLSFDEALKEFRRLGAQWDIASCSHNYGLLFFEEGDLVSAKQRLQEALQIQRALNDQRGVSSDLDDLGSVALSSGELPSAKQMKEQALQGFREMGDKRGQSVVLLNLGEVLYQQGDLSAATEKYNQAIVLQKEITRKTGLAHSFVGLAEVQMAQDRLDDARALAQQSLGLRQENKEDNHSAESNLLLAEIALHQAKPAEAEVLARQALGVFEKNKTDASSSLAYSLLACALVAQRKIPDARAASDHAMVLARPNGDRLIRIRAALAAAEVANAAGQSTEAERDLNLLLSQVNREGYVPFVFQRAFSWPKVNSSPENPR